MEASLLKIAVIGDNILAPYHPLENVQPLIEEILEDLADLTFFIGIEAFEKDLSAFDGLMIYSDNRKSVISDAGEGNLLRFVEAGGSLMVIHSGITVMNKEGLEVLTGARMLPHKEMDTLKFLYEDHLITDGLEPMAIYEEPYRYEIIEGIDRQVFLRYQEGEKNYDSGWLVTYGQGQVAVLHPGHNDFTFENPEFEEIIRKTLLYINNQLD